MQNNFNIRRINVNILNKFKIRERNSFFNRLMADLKEHIFMSDQMNILIGNVMYHTEVQDILSKTPLAHDATPDIVYLADECRGYLTRVKGTVDSLRNMPDAESKSQHKKLALWFKKATPVYILSTARVDQEYVMQSLSTAYEEDETIGETLEALGVDSAFKSAMAVNNAIVKLVNLRDRNKGHYKGVRLLNREDAVYDLQLLINEVIKMARQEGDQQELYQELARSIETKVIAARAQYESRMTRLANGELEDDEDEIGEGVNSTEENIDLRSEGSNGTTPELEGSTSDATNANNDSEPIE